MSAYDRAMTATARAFYAPFPSRLRAARQARRYTMQRLADLAGLAMDTVYVLEKGRSRPTSTSLIAICRVLGICPSSLFPALKEWHRG